MAASTAAATPGEALQKRAVIYLRVSTLKQVNKDFNPEGYSIPAQRDVCTAYANRQAATVVEEFVDKGESARSANRPDLQRMLRYIHEHPVDYVIFYDISRLARNELDAFQLLSDIEATGARLESATENIDTRTPSGRLMFGILASTQAFRSRGDGEKVKEGLRRKHASGGTPGVAPLGYLNTIVMVDGRAVRSITLDPERAPLVRLAFESYASGDYTISTLTELLQGLGLRSVARGKRPSRPLSRSYVHRLLRNPYYIGIVEFDGVRHEGRHDPLIDFETFQRVQDRLEASRLAGDRGHKHQHYLKGSIFCGACGAPLSYGRHRNRAGDHYEYFGCVARRRAAQPCPYLPVYQVEAAIERYWVSVRFTDKQRQLVRDGVMQLATARTEAARQDIARRQKELTKLERHQQKLLQLYYDDAVDKELLKREQQRIDAERADIERSIVIAQLSESEIAEALEEALALTRNADRVYRQAAPLERRLLNQAIFERLRSTTSGLSTATGSSSTGSSNAWPVAGSRWIRGRRAVARGAKRRPRAPFLRPAVQS